jgi:hypothetical protein
MATYSTATAVEPSALTALFSDREDADSVYEWLLKNGYNSSDVHLLMSEETRQKHSDQRAPAQRRRRRVD